MSRRLIFSIPVMKLVLIADRQQNRICTLCRCRRDNFGITRGVVNVVTGAASWRRFGAARLSVGGYGECVWLAGWRGLLCHWTRHCVTCIRSPYS